MAKAGSQILFKYGMGLVRGVIIDVDLTYFTVKFEYKKGNSCTMKIKKSAEEIVRIDGISTEAFTFKNNLA